MSYSYPIQLVVIVFLLNACQSSKQAIDAAPAFSEHAQATVVKEEIDVSGAILIDQANLSQFLEQALFIGIPNSSLEEPLVERKFVDTVRQSKVYQNLLQNGMQSPYVMTSARNHYFNYKAFRDELVYQGLIKKFGL